MIVFWLPLKNFSAGESSTFCFWQCRMLNTFLLCWVPLTLSKHFLLLNLSFCWSIALTNIRTWLFWPIPTERVKPLYHFSLHEEDKSWSAFSSKVCALVDNFFVVSSNTKDLLSLKDTKSMWISFLGTRGERFWGIISILCIL